MAANAPTTDENYKKGVTMTLDKAAKHWMPSMWRRSNPWASRSTPIS